MLCAATVNNLLAGGPSTPFNIVYGKSKDQWQVGPFFNVAPVAQIHLFVVELHRGRGDMRDSHILHGQNVCVDDRDR